MRAPRIPPRLLPLAFTLSLLLPALAGAQQPPPPPGSDTTAIGFIQHVRIGKAACDTCAPVACPGEPVPVTISGMLPSPCIAFRGFRELPVGAPFTVLQADFVADTCGKACPTVMVPFTATLSLPPPLPGTQSFVLMHQVRSCPDTTIAVNPKSRTYSFVIPETCPPPPADTTRIGFISHVEVGRSPCAGCPPRVCPGELVKVSVSGLLPSPCFRFLGLNFLPGSASPTIAAEFAVDTCGTACPTLRVPFSGDVLLPQARPGLQGFVLVHRVRSCPDTSVVRESVSRLYTYQVPLSCDSIPPDSLLRGFVNLAVTPERRCAGDTLRMRVAKNGCPPCFHLGSFAFDPVLGLRIQADWRPQCVEFACLPETLQARLGVFAAGHHEVVVRMDVHVLDTPVPDSTVTVRIRVPFDVLRDCPPPPTGCVQPWLVPARGDADCDVRVAAGGSGDLSLAVNTPWPLAGLEGRVECTAPFRVGSLRIPPGRAGWHLSWQPDGRGARYVLFSTPGFDIPAGQTPVLVAGLEVDATATDGQRASLVAPLALVSDPAGNAVPICDPSTLRPRPAALCVGATDDTCDVNGDGRADVRDLVRMTACLRPAAPDFDSAAVCHDCDGDGTFAFADLLCCARHILRAPLVPRDSVTASPDVRVEFGVPQRLGTDGWRVPVRVTGADALAGALLRLRYPADRWRADGLFQLADARGGTSSWMAISDFEQPGLVQLAWLQVGETPSPTLEMELAILPVGEVLDGDAISVVGADLVRPDGRTLEPTATLPELSLVDPAPGATPGRVVLGAARPNPFTGTTRFTVSLPAGAELELSVHDVAGRRVATLAHGRFAAGERDFTWDATGARDGVYFVRLVVDGRVLTTRVALLRDRR